MRKIITGLTVAALFAGGVWAVSAVTSPDIAAAVEAETVQAEDQDTATAGFVAGGRIATVLDGLVAQGVLTQDQADQVLEALREELPHPRKMLHRAHLLRLSAEVIGIEFSDLVSELRSGATLAEIAEDNGVDPQTLIDALVAAATEKIEAAADAGRIETDARAEMLAGVTDRITDLVNGELDLANPPLRRGPVGSPAG